MNQLIIRIHAVSLQQ